MVEKNNKTMPIFPFVIILYIFKNRHAIFGLVLWQHVIKYERMPSGGEIIKEFFFLTLRLPVTVTGKYRMMG